MLNVIAIANEYKKLPSELLNIDDSYTAYCFNEACAIIAMRLKNGEELVDIRKVPKEYKKPSDLYSLYR